MEKFTRGFLTLNNSKNDSIELKIKDLGLDTYKIIKINDKEAKGVLLNGISEIKSKELLEKIQYDTENENYDVSSVDDEFVSKIKIDKKYFFVIKVGYGEHIFDYFKKIEKDESIGLRTVEPWFVDIEKSSDNLEDFELLIKDLEDNDFEVTREKSLIFELEK